MSELACEGARHNVDQCLCAHRFPVKFCLIFPQLHLLKRWSLLKIWGDSVQKSTLT